MKPHCAGTRPTALVSLGFLAFVWAAVAAAAAAIPPTQQQYRLVHTDQPGYRLVLTDAPVRAQAAYDLMESDRFLAKIVIRL